MVKKALFLIFVIALGALAYFAYPIIKNRYFKNEVSIINNSNELVNDEILNENFDESKEIESDEIDKKTETVEEEIKDEIDENGDIENISANDCDNECQNFKDNSSNLKYCQNICGISPVKESENCENLKNEEKDYCFKNQAIEKADLKVCDLIFDSKIKLSCKNRVTEDLLEQE